ncbi:Cse1-domain-containing protein [Sistotremastrum niveocremeum HHB9708]|uniref:Cse1-domain-containing protein n=1 Tax=Sistotremastrum niveocremeum HHB9708 TaxID=1314777 RepID=A0A164Q063_9AGAM|nr:Cse1-domain-containing protein [Sistotremastrum niveocremeum HHB9708]
MSTPSLPSLLLASLSPSTQKAAESALKEYSKKSSQFIRELLRLGQDATQEKGVRLSACVYAKNEIKRRWALEEQDENPVDAALRNATHIDLLQAIQTLSTPTDKSLRVQVAEAVSFVASVDFPQQWPDLISSLVSALSPNNWLLNLSILETAHSIFHPWRSAIRTDELYSTINLVLSSFLDPFVQLYREVANTLLNQNPTNPDIVIAQNMVVLTTLFYDLTCQDLPPILEDAHFEFFGNPNGWFLRFLLWDPPSLIPPSDAEEGDDDPTPSIPSQIKTGILEIAELYTNRFAELLSTEDSTVQSLVQAVWQMIGSDAPSSSASSTTLFTPTTPKQKRLSKSSYDALISQSLKFLSTLIRSPHYSGPLFFSNKETIAGLIEGVVIPNVGLREREVEMFEDDPMEYIRVDLAPSGSAYSAPGGTSDGGTRRQAAADVIRAFVSASSNAGASGEGKEGDVTEVVGRWIGRGLEVYNADPNGEDKWKAKDAAIFLFGAVATRGSTAQQGVTSTNALINVVEFFSNHVLQDLQAPQVPHPILQVDAIRYLYTFRNQLTKEQLLAVLPLLVQHLGSPNYVSYSYAAITIERILFIKKDNRLLFSQADVHDFANAILSAVLSKIEAAGSPQKVAENDYLMKCAMRVIITARQSLTPHFAQILQRLIGILGVISKNPSNPNFDQYLFESIAALIRFITSGNLQTLTVFEEALLQPLMFILQEDIEQYVPYVFQLLSQLLELHIPPTPPPTAATNAVAQVAPSIPVPPLYASILPFLLTPSAWIQKGSIPGLVRLLLAYLSLQPTSMASSGQVASVLAVAQQRLIPSKVNDGWGFELIEGVVLHVHGDQMKPYFRAVLLSLLTRMQTSRTDKYAYSLVRFICYVMALQDDRGYGPNYLIAAIEEIQPQLWMNLLRDVFLPQIPQFLVKDRKLVVVGLTKLLTQSTLMLQPSAQQVWSATFTSLLQLLTSLSATSLASNTSNDDTEATGITEIDLEEQNAGYQAAYSRLAASESTVPSDPVSYVPSNTAGGVVGWSAHQFVGAPNSAAVNRGVEAVVARNPALADSVREFWAKGSGAS